MNTLQPQIFHAYKQQSGPIIFLTSDNYLVITEWMLGSEDDEVSDVVDDILSLCCYTILEVFQLCVVDVGGQCFTSHLFTFLFHSQWNSSHGTMVVKLKSEIEAIINKDKVLWFKWQIVYWCPWLCSQLLDQFVEIWSWSTLTRSSPCSVFLVTWDDIELHCLLVCWWHWCCGLCILTTASWLCPLEPTSTLTELSTCCLYCASVCIIRAVSPTLTNTHFTSAWRSYWCC